MKKKVYTVIETAQDGLSILQGAGTKSPEVLTLCLTEKTRGMDDAQISQLISKRLKGTGWRPEYLWLVLPRRLFILKTLSFPSQAEPEIKKMISLQLSAHVPYKEEDMVWDYVILEKTPAGHSRVLIMAVGIDVIRRYLKLLSLNNIHPAVVTFSSWGLPGWLNVIEGQNNGTGGAVYLLVHLEKFSTEICWCDRQKFYFSRHIDLGAQDVEGGHAADLTEQIRITMTAYRQEKMGPEPASGIILSMDERARSLQGHLQKNLQLPFTVKEPLKEIPRRNVAKSVNPETSLDGTGIAGLGLLARRWKGDDKHRIGNFLPSTLQDSFGFKAQFQGRLKSVLLLALALASVIAAMSVPLYQKSRYLAKIQDENRKMSPALQQVETRIRQWGALKNELSHRIAVVDIIDELYRLTPDGISYLSLHLQDTGTLTLQGRTFQGAAVNQLQSNLVNSPLLKNVTLQHATKRPSGMGEVTQFSISAVLTKKR